MQRGSLFLLVGILALWAALQPASGQVPLERPGKCPTPTGAGTCVEECGGDHQCPQGKKCCSNGCGHVCMPGIQAVKPGKCPPDYIRCIRAEEDQCRRDEECRGQQKCCYNACARRCVEPVPGTGAAVAWAAGSGQSREPSPWLQARGTAPVPSRPQPGLSCGGAVPGQSPRSLPGGLCAWGWAGLGVAEVGQRGRPDTETSCCRRPAAGPGQVPSTPAGWEL
ncbi:WAP four-disulfide core domain protein 5-like [Alligator sinensis]|uniref:WAP four-disulfide core domain protein 5-like n=1 Tax=Alligator sinensis TaxID=38654 RepID=A0A3Q0HBV9_ALLSI|nr:WAP four-disulfide core domain protein 5-like [Alligator sinensis]